MRKLAFRYRRVREIYDKYKTNVGGECSPASSIWALNRVCGAALRPSQSFCFSECLDMKSNHSPSAKRDQISMESKRVRLPTLNSMPVQSGSYVARGGQRQFWCRQCPVANFV